MLLRTVPVVPTALQAIRRTAAKRAARARAAGDARGEALPADYQAIEDLFLEGEGV
jgi:hypothetical protein